jgi:hypothetical protein
MTDDQRHAPEPGAAWLALWRPYPNLPSQVASLDR